MSISKKSRPAIEKRASFFFYRNKDKNENNLLIVRDQTIYSLEFKKTVAPNNKMAEQFRLLEQLKRPVKEGGIISLSKTLLPISETLNAIPFGLLKSTPSALLFTHQKWN